MQTPNNALQLANLLKSKTFKRVESLTDLVGESAVGFLNNIEQDKIIVSDQFPRYIPVVKESISVKKHDYNVTCHVIFWLADGEPYIHTPSPTIEHIRHGMKNSKLVRGSHLMIPHNCHAFDVLALKEGLCNDPQQTEILDLVVTRYKK